MGLNMRHGISKNGFIIFAYVAVLALAAASIYVIYFEVELVLEIIKENPKVPGTFALPSKFVDQIVAIMSTFFILIILTVIFLIYLVRKSNDNHHSQILTLNHLLFFYGLITVIPLASIQDDAGKMVELIEIPLSCSILTIVVSVGIVIYYTMHGSASYLNHHPISNNSSEKNTDYQTLL